MPKRVIVTGGCGYIGSHVARAFKQAGDTVTVIDRVQRGHTLSQVDGGLIADFASQASFQLITEQSPDIIVHCAGTSLVGPSILNPQEYYENNIIKTIQLLNHIKTLRRRPIILFSSSASVYGEPDQTPIPESADTHPVSPYGNTKLMTEAVFNDYFRAYQIPSLCFRYFNAAGAVNTQDLGQAAGATHIIARVLESQINNSVFTLNGADYNTADGTCIRDYVHVQDIAHAHILGAEYLLNNPQALVLNLGTNQGISNRQIIDYVRNKYGDIQITTGTRRPGDPKELVADATQARQLLNWNPQNSQINTIIDSAYNWYCGPIHKQQQA